MLFTYPHMAHPHRHIMANSVAIFLNILLLGVEPTAVTRWLSTHLNMCSTDMYWLRIYSAIFRPYLGDKKQDAEGNRQSLGTEIPHREDTENRITHKQTVGFSHTSRPHKQEGQTRTHETKERKHGHLINPRLRKLTNYPIIFFRWRFFGEKIEKKWV